MNLYRLERRRRVRSVSGGEKAVRKKSGFRPGPLALVVFGLVCISAPVFAQTLPVTLAWDANQ